MTPALDTRTLASGRTRALRFTVVAVAVALAACVNSESSGGPGDHFAPSVSLAAGTSSDSVLTFTISAADNLGLLTVEAAAAGPGLSSFCDTTFHSAVTSFSMNCTIGVPSGTPIGTTVTIVGQSVDGNHNISPVDTLIMVTGGGTPSQVRITQPLDLRDTVAIGFSTALSILGQSQRKVHIIGWTVTGALNFVDSVIFNSPLKDSISVDTSLSFVAASVGTATVTPFMYDSLGTVYTGNPVRVVVVSSAGAGTIPVVNFGITKRVEVTDTIHVTATDRAGVAWLGYVIRQMPPSNLIITRDSIQIIGNFTTAVKTFTMALPIVNFPTLVQVEAFARNQNGITDSARIPVGNTGYIRKDTVTVVAGLTRPLPNGGAVADGIYHPPTNRLYLTNIARNELEVFDLSDSTFHAPIPVGSRPWGIAARPLDHGAPGVPGTMSDTLIVANSGATLLSFVDVNPATAHEVYRYALPNIIFHTCTSAVLGNGQLVEHCTVHDFSDRPQYIAAACIGAGPCGDLYVAYTTTPTAAQATPFTNKGTIRWENITRTSSHFFFEQAIGQGDAVTVDTILIERFQSSGFGSDSTLVPFVQGPFITGADTSFFSITTNTPIVGFRDTTFARNSGSFARAAFGEGGAIAGQSGVPNARAMSYDVNVGMVPQFCDKGHCYNSGAGFLPVIDGGVSRPGDVSDFVVNTATSVTGIAINLDGSTIGIRADSTYLVNTQLRLMGLLQTSGGNVGLDFHPLNSGLPSPGPTGGTQMMFTSSANPEILVFNTNYFQQCLSIPTRDPIIGPIKSALVGGGATMLVGATQFGVVVVTIPQAQMTAACP